MSDDVYRPSRKKIENEDNPPQVSPKPENTEDNPLQGIKSMQEAVAKEMGQQAPETPFGMPDSGLQIKGNVPPEFQTQMGRPMEAPKSSNPPPPMPDDNIRITGSGELESLLERISEVSTWEALELPSKGKFYKNIPATIHVRPMTGEEEQILATPRWVKTGKAIDMIFKKCIKEKIPTEDLLSVDRNYLLIFLRGISYTPEYDVEIKCPACATNFATTINLDELEVEDCPDDFDVNQLVGELPKTKCGYRYRLATGADEQAVTAYRDRRVQMFGDQSNDDTLLFRTATLLDWLEGVTATREIQVVLKKLPIQDVSHLRNTINEPPFGVDTKIPMVCPSCAEEFSIELPLETDFFFPRKKKEPKAQA